VAEYLREPHAIALDRLNVRLAVRHPLRWVTPQIVLPDDQDPSRKRLLAWTDELVRFPRVDAHQAGRRIGSLKLPWPAAPGRMFRIPSVLVKNAQPERGSVEISLRR